MVALYEGPCLWLQAHPSLLLPFPELAFCPPPAPPTPHIPTPGLKGEVSLSQSLSVCVLTCPFGIFPDRLAGGRWGRLAAPRTRPAGRL